MSKKVLVVEDEADIRDLIHFNLFKEKFNVEVCDNGTDALKMFSVFKPDLVLLDLMLPGKSGLEICQEIKNSSKSTFVIMVTARGEEEDIIKGFEMGADDYISKPFSPKILIARVKAVLGRKLIQNNTEISKISFHIFSLDCDRREFFINNSKTELTFSEFQIMELLLKNLAKFSLVLRLSI